VIDATITERELQAAIVQAAGLGGWLCYHTHDSRRSAAGYPDITLVRGSKLIFAELKSDRGRLTAEQRAWLGALRSAGADARVVRPSDLEDVVIMLTSRPR
jgi:hypothetical protein